MKQENRGNAKLIVLGAAAVGTLLARISSTIPPTSPLVIPVRASVADVPAGEMLLSIALVVAATFGLNRLGGRVDQGSQRAAGRMLLVRRGR